MSPRAKRAAAGEVASEARAAGEAASGASSRQAASGASSRRGGEQQEVGRHRALDREAAPAEHERSEHEGCGERSELKCETHQHARVSILYSVKP